MRTFVFLTALLFALAQVSAQDGEEAAVQLLTVKATGDSVYDLVAEASISPAPDLTSARGVVAAWGVLTGEKATSNEAAHEEARAKVANLTAQAMGELEGVLLSESVAGAQAEKRANPVERARSYEYTRHLAEIVEETSQPDGSVLVVTGQKWETKRKNDRTGEWETTAGELRMRYSVLKGEDGRWRINSIEQGEKPSSEESSDYGWRAYQNFQRELAIEGAATAKLTKPDIKTATPEDAALSFAIDVRSFNEQVPMHMMMLVCKAMADLSNDWFTAEYKDAERKRVEDKMARSKKEDPPLEVEEVRDATDTSATVIFKFTDSKASDKLVVKVIKEGDAWKVTEVGDLRNAGKATEKYEAKQDIYRRW